MEARPRLEIAIGLFGAGFAEAARGLRRLPNLLLWVAALLGVCLDVWLFGFAG